MTNNNALNQRYEAAQQIAKEAGELTLRYFESSVTYERKSDNTPVTIADREAELLMRKRISESFPDDGILGEEHPEVIGSSGFRWILDPIDGTKSFITGVPLYGTLVGVEYQNTSLIGVIELPALSKRVFAAQGQGAFVQHGHDEPKEASVSNCDNFANAIFLTSEVLTFQEQGVGAVYRELEQKCWIARTWGDCFGYYLVATGQADIMVDAAMSIWDSAALLPVIQEAGGAFVDWSGKPTIHSKNSLATNHLLLNDVLNTISSSN